MKKSNKVYTKAETEQFLHDRNLKRDTDRKARKELKFIHISQKMVYMKDDNGKDIPLLVKAWDKGKTFIGSVRNQFTGARRAGI